MCSNIKIIKKQCNKKNIIQCFIDLEKYIDFI